MGAVVYNFAMARVAWLSQSIIKDGRTPASMFEVLCMAASILDALPTDEVLTFLREDMKAMAAQLGIEFDPESITVEARSDESVPFRFSFTPHAELNITESQAQKIIDAMSDDELRKVIQLEMNWYYGR